jgi:hypothetical protein
MSTKRLLAISLLLPLVVMSATAHAGSTISDKSYWPSEASQSVQNRTGRSSTDWNSAFSYDRATSRSVPAAKTGDGAEVWRYHGGPKSLR